MSGLRSLRVVLRQGLIDDLAFAAGQGEDLLRELQDGNLARIAEVDRLMEIDFEQLRDPVHQVIHVAETARLRAVAVDRQRLAAQRLAHEVRQHPAIVQTHAAGHRC